MTITDRIQRYKGCRYPDALPDGRTARVVWGVTITTPTRSIPFPPGASAFDCLRIGPDGQIAGTANVGGFDHAWLWDGEWRDKGIAPGRNAVAFGPDGDLYVVASPFTVHRFVGPTSTIGITPAVIPTNVGSIGIRFISWDDRIITSASSYEDPARGLYEFTDWGDVAIGQGAKPDQGIVVRFKDDGILRRFCFGQARDVRWERDHDKMALSWTQQDTDEACVWTGLVSELRALPAVAAPQPPPVPPPVPPVPPKPPVPPDPIIVRPVDRLVSPNGEYEAKVQDDGNFVVYRIRDGKVISAAGADASEPQPEPEPALPRLRVDGRRLLMGDKPFVWRGVTAFRLVEMAAHGNEAGAAAYLDWARDQGFSVVRVLTMCHGMFRLAPEEGRDALPFILRAAARRGLYVHVVALADTASYPDMNIADHVAAVGRICAEHDNVALVEVANEPYHGTQAYAVHDVAYLEDWAARVPEYIPVAFGTASNDESIEMGDGADAITVHLDRGRDEWNMVRRVRALEEVSVATGRYVINSEPIGAAEANEPGRRNANDSIHFTFGALSRVFGVGSTFHLEAGLHCMIPGPVQQACAEAFIAGTQIVPDDVELRFYNARNGNDWADSPVQAARFAEGEPKPDACVRAYSGVWGNQGVVVVVGVMGDAGVVYGNGWRATVTLAELPGVQVWGLQR